MHVKSLKVFCDVVVRRSFSRAADENGISQSGASQMVHHLETELGVKLLDRSKRPFVLTAEGKVYYEGCRRLVQRFYALEEEVRTLHQGVEGRVAIASIYSIGLSHLNGLLDEFAASHPKAEVSPQYHHPTRVYELVEQDQVDLGLVSYPKSSRTIKGFTWLEEQVRLVCSADHPFAHRLSLPVEALDGLEMVGFDTNLKVRQEFDRALAAHRVEPSVVMEFDNTETIKRAIEMSGGLGLLPEPTVERELQQGTLVALPVDGLSLVRPIGVIKRRGVELGKTARRFIDLIRNRAEGEESSADIGRPDESSRLADSSAVEPSTAAVRGGTK